MKILDLRMENGVMTAALLAEADEFASALDEAYAASGRAVPGFEAGKAPRTEIERLWGPSAFYDEALDILIPRLYGRFINENDIEQAEPPQVLDVKWPGGGCAAFSVRAAVCPKVRPEGYKGIKAPDGDGFLNAVMARAVSTVKAEIPEVLIEKKLDAMLAAEKLKVNGDPIYNVLADFVYILDKAFRAAGMARSMAQVKSEALDIMLRTLSGDNSEVSRDMFINLVTGTVAAYREIPEDFDAESIIDDRAEKKRAMTDGERADEVFGAYLGSLDIDEDAWRSAHRQNAEWLVKKDVLLDGVARAEGLGADGQEIAGAVRKLAAKYGVDADVLKNAVDPAAVAWQIRRDKAERFIVENAERE